MPIYDNEWIRKKHFPTINMVKLLQKRELELRKTGTHFYGGAREFYQCIPPAVSVHGVEKEHMLIKRFSPDGRYLITFSENREISLYEYVGLNNLCKVQRTDLFSKIFKHLCNFYPHEFVLEDGHTLFSDWLFFTSDSRHLVVALKHSLPDHAVTFAHMLDNNESLGPSEEQPFLRINVFCLDLEAREICSRFEMPVEWIHPKTGVHLVGRTLVILSVPHQTILLLRIDEKTGEFIALKEIGRTFSDAELNLLDRSMFGTVETVLPSLKQRLVAHLYRSHKKYKHTNEFFYTFGQIRALRMTEIRLVGEDMILIRFVNQEALTNVSVNAQLEIFAFLNWKTGEVLRVFDQYSEELVHLISGFQEDLKNAHILDNRYPCTEQYSQHAYQTFHVHMLLNFVGSRRQGYRESVYIPYYTTHMPTISPYLDPEVFSYDESLIAAIEAERLRGSYSISFFSRITYQLLFRMEMPEGGHVSLLFHPTDPLALSFNRSERRSNIVTLHLPRYCFIDWDQEANVYGERSKDNNNVVTSSN